ncbi:RNA-directed DNA polymerase, eukaryota [Tanacetum coccineum]
MVTTTNSKILFVVVYASQHGSRKRMLWDYISTILGRWNGESIVMGDFNEVRSSDERGGVSRDEIRKAQFEFGYNKTPGPDDSPSKSFRILDVIDAKFVNDFRPISLIGCIYKVVTKILANRLVSVISDLVSETQSAFVAGRQIIDGPFILDETVGITYLMFWRLSVIIGVNGLRIKEKRRLLESACDKASSIQASHASMGLKYFALNRCSLLNGFGGSYLKTGSLWSRIIDLICFLIRFTFVESFFNWSSIMREVQSLKTKGFDFLSHCKKRVGNGINSLFWFDCWIGDAPLHSIFPRLFALELDKNITVAAKLNSEVDSSFRRSARGGIETYQLQERSWSSPPFSDAVFSCEKIAPHPLLRDHPSPFFVVYVGGGNFGYSIYGLRSGLAFLLEREEEKKKKEEKKMIRKRKEESRRRKKDKKIERRKKKREKEEKKKKRKEERMKKKEEKKLKEEEMK